MHHQPPHRPPRPHRPPKPASPISGLVIAAVILYLVFRRSISVLIGILCVIAIPVACVVVIVKLCSGGKNDQNAVPGAQKQADSSPRSMLKKLRPEAVRQLAQDKANRTGTPLSGLGAQPARQEKSMEESVLTHRFTQAPFSTKSSVFLMIAGGVLAFSGFLSACVLLLRVLAHTGIPKALYISTVLCSLSGIVLLIIGSRCRERVLRFRRYLSVIGDNKVIELSRLASVCGTNPNTAKNDVQALLDRGHLQGAYIDHERGLLIFGNPFAHENLNKTPQKSANGPQCTPAQEIRQLNEEIKDEEISQKLDRLEEITQRIWDYAQEHPEQEDSLKKFSAYYMPMTKKILDAYARFERQGLNQEDAENIGAAMRDIEEILDVLIRAFEKQLDHMFRAEALDISTDVTVLENLLAKEGLIDSGFKVGVGQDETSNDD